MSSTSTIQTVMQRHRAALLAREAEASREMEQAWRGAAATITSRLTWLTRQINEARAASEDGVTLRPSWLYEQQRLTAVLDMVNHQITLFSRSAEATVAHYQGEATQAGAQDSAALLDATVPPGVSWTFGVPNPAAVQEFVGRASNGSPLGDLFDGFGAEASAKVRTTLVSGLATGLGTDAIARQVRDDLGISLARARTISRTEVLGAYRRAAAENYRANSDVVEQWRWSADLSSNTCGMCLGMDGTLHDLDEDLDSHPNCRCTQVPVTRSWADILGEAGISAEGIDETSAASTADDMQTGAQWFDEQDAAVQREILGPAKAAAYAAGDLTLADLVGVEDDPEWGRSHYEKSLTELGLSAKGA